MNYVCPDQLQLQSSPTTQEINEQACLNFANTRASPHLVRNKTPERQSPRWRFRFPGRFISRLILHWAPVVLPKADNHQHYRLVHCYLVMINRKGSLRKSRWRDERHKFPKFRNEERLLVKPCDEYNLRE